MTDQSSLLSRRIHALDEARGIAIVLMVVFHGFYTAGFLFGMEWGKALFVFFMPAQPFFAGVFIFICGVSCRLSHNNLKRGVLLLLVALLVTLILWLFLPQEIILFGILHFLAVSILLFWLLRPLLDRVPPAAGLAVCAALLLLTWWTPAYKGGILGIKNLFSWPVPPALTRQAWLFPVGFSKARGADYVPLLPWFFCFLGGSFFGIWAKRGRFPAWMYRRHAPFLSAAGRHSLLIYILHQPILYAACWLGARLM